jgi:hypothetical protein
VVWFSFTFYVGAPDKNACPYVSCVTFSIKNGVVGGVRRLGPLTMPPAANAFTAARWAMLGTPDHHAVIKRVLENNALLEKSL